MKAQNRKIICYDLHGADRDDYNDLYEYIEKTYNGVRATESVYVIDTVINPGDIRDSLIKLCGKRKISILVGPLPFGVHTSNIPNYEEFLEK